MSKEDFVTGNKLFSEIKKLIEESKQKIAISVNSEMTLLHWHIGKQIKQEILQGKRAEYGKQILGTLSKQLTLEFGKGWSEKQLRHCLRIAETFDDKKIISALSRELTWTHLKTLIYIEDKIKRDFYIEMCRLEKWSTRTLQTRINSMLFERTAISKKPDETIKYDLEQLKKEEKITPIGLILCASKNEEHIELLQLDKSNIKVAEFLTKLPDLKLLEKKLHLSIERAKNRFAQKNIENK